MAEIETDKATMEFEAVDEGTIGKILVAEGTDNVKVGTVIATIAGEGEDAARRRRSRADGRKVAKSRSDPGGARHRAGRGTDRTRAARGDQAQPSRTRQFPRAPRWSR